MIYYPFSYMFRAPAMLLPHESTVAHEHHFNMEEPMISRSRLRPDQPTDSAQFTQQVNDEIQKLTSVLQLNDKSTTVPHTRPVTPRAVTHNHDEDYTDEESDPNDKGDVEENSNSDA